MLHFHEATLRLVTRDMTDRLKTNDTLCSRLLDIRCTLLEKETFW